MPVERSAGAVVFRDTKKGRVYLVLQHPGGTNRRVSRPTATGHWDFPKGHIEKGEKTEDTVRREVKEETGIRRITFIPGFKETIRYFVNYDGAKRLKFVAFFLAITRETRVIISPEHQAYAWLDFPHAYRRLTYANAKAILKKAEAFLAK